MPDASASLPRTLIAVPVYNEARTVRGVLERVLSIHPDVLVIDDGSTDGTIGVLPTLPVEVVRHARNRGYGASLADAFAFARLRGYEWLITMDCDEQHEPAWIPRFMEAASSTDADVLSGSRYLQVERESIGSAPGAMSLPTPTDRRAINQAVTRELNQRLSGVLGCELTDGFCGFKAYRVEALARLSPTVPGYAFPMQFWVQAAAQRLRVRELPVARIYVDPGRTFGGSLDDPALRLAHYRDVLHAEVRSQRDRLPRGAWRDLVTPCACAQGHTQPGRDADGTNGAGDGAQSSDARADAAHLR